MVKEFIEMWINFCITFADGDKENISGYGAVTEHGSLMILGQDNIIIKIYAPGFWLLCERLK